MRKICFIIALLMVGLAFAQKRQTTTAKHGTRKTTVTYESKNKAHAKDEPSDADEQDIKPDHTPYPIDMLLATQKVVVIDSVVVGREQLCNAIALDPNCGTLLNVADLPKEISQQAVGIAYCNSFKDRIIFTKQLNDSCSALVYSDRYGNKWSTPTTLPGLADSTASQGFPFLLADGTTLYFATKNKAIIPSKTHKPINEGGAPKETSQKGKSKSKDPKKKPQESEQEDIMAESEPTTIPQYDIFITRYDNDTKAYLKPENIGLPFNSIDDDYIMAIDEVNNLGWFVSSRNQPANKVCVYVFIPSPTRVIYQGLSQDSLIMMASLNSIKATQHGKEQEVTAALQRLKDARATHSKASSRLTTSNDAADLNFIVGYEKIYHKVEEFSNQQARKLAGEWAVQSFRRKQLHDLLRENRQKFASSSSIAEKKAFSSVILRQENEIEQLDNEITELANRIRTLENANTKKR